MNHSFDVEIAQQYGVDAAILIENFRFWIAKNKANNRHFYDGRYWTYNSAKAFAELFPYWSEGQITRIIKKLEEAGVLLSGNYNNSPYDRTKWYSLSQEFHLSKTINGKSEIDKSLTDINTDIKPNINQTTPTASPDGFAEFWSAYPKKVAKGYAEKAWKKNKPPLEIVLQAIENQKKSEKWTKDGGKFIPNPATWLNGKCWEDGDASPQKPELCPNWCADAGFANHWEAGNKGCWEHNAHLFKNGVKIERA